MSTPGAKQVLIKVHWFTSWKQKGIAKTLTPMMQLTRLNITGLVLIMESPDQRKNKQKSYIKDVKSDEGSFQWRRPSFHLTRMQMPLATRWPGYLDFNLF